MRNKIRSFSVLIFQSIIVLKYDNNHACSLSKDDDFKANALSKIADILENQNTLANQFREMSENHDFYNFDLVTKEFVNSLDLLGNNENVMD